MSEQILFNRLVFGWILLAVIVFIILFFFNAPYGRYHRGGWGLSIDNSKGWVIMESASPVVFALCFLFGSNMTTITAAILLFMWEAHYIHRAFFYPFGLRGLNKRMPVGVIGMAFIFNAVNAYLNGRYIFTLSDGYANEWLGDPRFAAGAALFLAGFMINRRADHILRGLRKPGESDYKIAYGGMYRWISSPNYFGEIIIWTGWAIATWSLPGLAFAVWTIANLIPRARAHHSWYREHFPDYPQDRKSLIPRLW